MQPWSKAKIWQETVSIPTYKVGEPNKNPMFLEKRVFQGSSGKVYPYPVIDKIYDEKEDLPYQAVYLENEYIKVMVLPELGGRIQRAYDKTNDYDFVYYNQVIKPALVGLLGPWISGGIEFNWPQHHRPTTFMPVEFDLRENADGSVTVELNDVDQMYGTKALTRISLYPGKAYIEIDGQLYNPTNMPQTFLWWANPAVAVNDYTQSVFPPDVHAVMDHGKRDVSRFPIAKGVYYKHDYSAGVDISRYKNIPVPTSYMAEKSNYDFVGGYDYRVGAGLLHVADHHISPGKKQWTWGNGDFGQAWDRNLTDEDGPYIELMTGMFTDNQPDFTWLKPFEEKSFKQYFMPYKGVGYVKNATKEAVLRLELVGEKLQLVVYTTSAHEAARILITHKGEPLLDETISVNPASCYEAAFNLPDGVETDLAVTLFDEDGQVLVSYTPEKPEILKLPEPAKAAKDPAEIMSNEELYLTGLHIEQYRHATYDPDPYYLEGLRRDPGDSRINTAYGSLLMRRGQLALAEDYFRKAIERLTWKNPNPYDSEAYEKLGICLLYQNRLDEAFDAFYKATWTAERQELSFYYLAAIASRKGDYLQALALVEKALVRNLHNIKARGLKAALLQQLGQKQAAEEWIAASLAIDPYDFMSQWESGQRENIHRAASAYLQLARDYAEAGFYSKALAVLEACSAPTTLMSYYRAYYTYCSGTDLDEVRQLYAEAERCSSDFCFPNTLEDLQVLANCLEVYPEAGFAAYYLGCLWYDKKQYTEAVDAWELAAEAVPVFPTVWRNLSLAYYNHMDQPAKAKEAMEKAFALDATDSRIFLELDQLYKKLGETPAQRLARYEANLAVALERDDAAIEYVTLLNFTGAHQQAYDYLMSRTFHPWEGGEGKATGQYVLALVQLAKAAIADKAYAHALELLQQALTYPANLGEGKLEGCTDNNIFYYMGLCYEAMGEAFEATNYFGLAQVGSDEVAGMMFYNDQPADLIFYQGLAKYMLGKTSEGNARMYRLIDYGEQHLDDEVKIEYFAVSFPDFMIYNEDFTRKNRAHCYYVMGLGHLGLDEPDFARKYFEQTLELDPSHQNCKLLLEDL